MDKKQSSFIEEQSISDSDYLGFFGSSVNRKITWARFKVIILDFLAINFLIGSPSTLAAAQLMNLPVNAMVRTKGCIAIGDGGSGDYLVSDTAPTAIDGYSVAEMANGRYLVLQPVNGAYNLFQLGAVSGTNCTAALNLARDISGSTRHKISIPVGTFFTTKLLIEINDVCFEGQSKEGSIIKLVAATSDHVIQIGADAENIVLKNFTIDQDRTTSTSGHGIRLGGCKKLTLEDLHIKNCFTYGIGVQAGTNEYVSIRNLIIENVGQDGIDIKDFNQANRGIVINNLTVINNGQLEPAKPGVDWRGDLTIDGLTVISNAAEMIGFRARLETTQGQPGTGNVSNVRIVRLGDPANSSGFVLEGGALSINISKRVNVTNISVTGTERVGLFGHRTKGNIKNVFASSIAGNLFQTNSAGVVVDGVVVNSCLRIVNAQAETTGFRLQNINVDTITGADIFAIASGAFGVQIDGGVLPAGLAINDSSGNETIKLHNVTNYPTKATLVSPALAIDSAGTRTFALAHGFAFTPRVEDIQLTVSRDVGAASDHRITLLQVDSVTSTLINGRAVVTTASATVGATVKVTATVNTKYSI